MTELAKGQSNLAQLAIRGNYRAVTAQDMAKVNPINHAQQQLFVASFARSAFLKDASLGSVKK